MDWKVEIKILLKESILDPQGQAVEGGLEKLDYNNVSEVQVGKHIELELEDLPSKEEASKQVDEMCQRLLANPVIEDYTFEIEELEG
ncbi:phosphoribosylformylglycinamidine synthase subunit PurS [Acetohalobium arabaticum]|uniref:Phosphoribosylformylglycinamidine synthase subunit PurS n=1 Tax=Acetohalobium arabaticum (strain ATCC 49924 / DSM 5501 / Z-7288) TaxID=574087 RepID=D9QUJ6_ACEAZ|nr:phosphoribosylformylglycinamidine synthase subunit PurS [Acetohalobium arabaticum]ADL13797.1 phosphoribosylformylglycinamidine synthase, purS [Acetohalobium arabaticum DSM 5501]